MRLRRTGDEVSLPAVSCALTNTRSSYSPPTTGLAASKVYTGWPFASVAAACSVALGIDLEKLNPNGGAIALGHPVGATGAILVVKLMYELERRDARYGLASLCIGGGQGIASIFERVS